MRAMNNDFIHIKGAREHNLKNISVKIPRYSLCVVTGLSGSGKSSLAFDTIYAEGQRRYVESLSAYARQFIEQLQKPHVDHIEGLSPSISIEQRTSSKNPRSTVGTQTEIYDYLRVLFANIGKQKCPSCGKEISSQSSQEIVDRILSVSKGEKIVILAPIIRGRKGEHVEILKDIRKNGIIRVRLDGKIVDIGDRIPELNKKIKHTIEAVVDRLVIKDDARQRISDSVESALKMGDGVIITAPYDDKVEIFDIKNDILYSEKNACAACGISFQKLLPRNFSFNSPYGACSECNGLGNKQEIDPSLIVPDTSESIIRAVVPWRKGGTGIIFYYRREIRALARYYKFDFRGPFSKLSEKYKKIIFYGDEESGFEGVIPNLERRFRETESEYVKEMISEYMSMTPCPACSGNRLKPESLSVYIENRNISDVCALSIRDAIIFFANLKLSVSDKKIAEESVKEINSRLNFLKNVGLDYLALDRKSNTLSGGEDQRIRLATQIGAGLVGVLYVLDEPSIGLHQKDNDKLLDTLTALRDLGNTLIVVEHDEATMRKADYIIDLGPGAGEHGGEVVAEGTVNDILKAKESLTGKYLRGDLKILAPEKRRAPVKDKFLEINGASEHNLKNINVKIPLGVFTCVTGVSGSGKSTLIHDILYNVLAKHLYAVKTNPGRHKNVKGLENLDKVIVIDQSPIGRTPRSNPATYTGMFSHIRELFSSLPESRMRGYNPGRFSFNVKGGRCESCSGDGMKKIEMHFLPDVYVECEVCNGKRFNDQTLEVKYKGLNISDILGLSVEEAWKIFENIPPIKSKLRVLLDVGLGYIRLGQQATTISGGEAQRVKLATELSRTATGKTIYILDEPTTGLHFADIHKLLDVLQRLVSNGNTILVIEHNLDVIKCADYIIDLGPEGGEKGGELVASGTPEEIAAVKKSYTGQYLKDIL
ncbi:excinuclease ABC subunit A [Candidatus Omnitrophus magneticus]|uniref:UvrABC system protein A n=1 Tax=Candidatus Omnitrophus magneticus TaxID=1609969 RepID=A0A0F0CJA9_9BACT|nr:excinuclease ABC subunit A [Candidatus Omnitrophus magneticus]